MFYHPPGMHLNTIVFIAQVIDAQPAHFLRYRVLRSSTTRALLTHFVDVHRAPIRTCSTVLLAETAQPGTRRLRGASDRGG